MLIMSHLQDRFILFQRVHGIRVQLLNGCVRSRVIYLEKAIEDSRRAMSYFSPNVPQNYKHTDHMRFPTLGANEAELESKYSQ